MPNPQPAAPSAGRTDLQRQVLAILRSVDGFVDAALIEMKAARINLDRRDLLVIARAAGLVDWTDGGRDRLGSYSQWAENAARVSAALRAPDAVRSVAVLPAAATSIKPVAVPPAVKPAAAPAYSSAEVTDRTRRILSHAAARGREQAAIVLINAAGVSVEQAIAMLGGKPIPPKASGAAPPQKVASWDEIRAHRQRDVEAARHGTTATHAQGQGKPDTPATIFERRARDVAAAVATPRTPPDHGRKTHVERT